MKAMIFTAHIFVSLYLSLTKLDAAKFCHTLQKLSGCFTAEVRLGYRSLNFSLEKYCFYD